MKRNRVRTPHGDDRWCADITRALPGPGVQAELNVRRQELWTGTADRLRALLPKVLEVLEQELEGENRLQAAVHVLKACGLYGGVPVPQGPTEVEDAVIAEQQRQGERRRAALMAAAW